MGCKRKVTRCAYLIHLDFASALSNPIAYQSNLEKHEQQLEILTTGFGMTSELIDGGVVS